MASHAAQFCLRTARLDSGISFQSSKVSGTRLTSVCIPMNTGRRKYRIIVEYSESEADRSSSNNSRHSRKSEVVHPSSKFLEEDRLHSEGDDPLEERRSSNGTASVSGISSAEFPSDSLPRDDKTAKNGASATGDASKLQRQAELAISSIGGLLDTLRQINAQLTTFSRKSYDLENNKASDSLHISSQIVPDLSKDDSASSSVHAISESPIDDNNDSSRHSSSVLPGKVENSSSTLSSSDAQAPSIVPPTQSFPSPSRQLLPPKKLRYWNKFLGLAMFWAHVRDYMEKHLKSELTRRLLVTAVLLIASRAGHFFLLPGFDRSFVNTSAVFTPPSAGLPLDMSAEVPLTLFQLGIGPSILINTVVQVAMALKVIPLLEVMRQAGPAGQRKVETFIKQSSLVAAFIIGLTVARQYSAISLLASSSPIWYYLKTAGLLAAGASILGKISDLLTNEGFGHGSSLLICMSILSTYSSTTTTLLRSSPDLLKALVLVAGPFLVMTACAVLLITATCRLELEYFGFEHSAESARAGEAVQPYVPFSLVPEGMMPILGASMLLAILRIGAEALAVVRGSGGTRLFDAGASGLVSASYYVPFFLVVVATNMLDMQETPKELASYLIRTGARIPGVPPGKGTRNHVTRVQTSARLTGGVLMALLAMASTAVDTKWRGLFQGTTIGITQILIVVGTIISLKRTVEAYQQLPKLEENLKQYHLS